MSKLQSCLQYLLINQIPGRAYLISSGLIPTSQPGLAEAPGLTASVRLHSKTGGDISESKNGMLFLELE